jgi:hypothetical protein
MKFPPPLLPCFLSLLPNYIASLLSKEKNLLGEFVIILAIIKNCRQVFKRAHEQKAGGTTVRREPFLCLKSGFAWKSSRCSPRP